MSAKITEFALEGEALNWFSELGYETLYGPDISPGEGSETGKERSSYNDVILKDRLLGALQNINPDD